MVRRAVLCVLLLVSLLGGCGLADYEKRMDQQRERLRIIDEENKYLGDMLEPPVADKDGARPIPFDIFLRLPRGISKIIADKDGAYSLQDQIIYRYPGPEGYNFYLAAGLAGTRDQKKELKKGEWPPEEFRENF